MVITFIITNIVIISLVALLNYSSYGNGKNTFNKGISEQPK